MKATIREGIPGDALRHAVPPRYRDLVSEKVTPDKVYTLLLFAHTERDVVHSLPVRRALRQPSGDVSSDVIAVGTTFTREAKQLLPDIDAVIIELRTTKWTDASAADRQQ